MGQQNQPKSSGKWWAQLELNLRPLPYEVRGQYYGRSVSPIFIGSLIACRCLLWFVLSHTVDTKYLPIKA